jgi:hypothetical protein
MRSRGKLSGTGLFGVFQGSKTWHELAMGTAQRLVDVYRCPGFWPRGSPWSRASTLNGRTPAWRRQTNRAWRREIPPLGRDDREEGRDDKPQTGGKQRGMIPKDCKRLAEVDFPIAVVSRHFRRERSPSGMDIVHLWWAARRPLAAWSRSYPSSRPFFVSSRPKRRDLAPPGAIPSAQLIPAPQDSYLMLPQI